MAYIGKSPDGTGVRSRFYYTQISGGGTSVSGSSDDGTTLTFSDGAYVDVYLNGVLLVAGTDYNTTTTNTIAGLAALANGDVVEVVVYDIFTVADTVSSLNGGTFSGAVIMSDGLTVDDDGATPLTVDRATSFGTVIDVQKDGTNGLSAGVHVANNGFVGTGDTGLRFSADNDAVMPYNTSTLASRDNGIDLGLSSVRFKNLYLGGNLYIGGTGSANALDDYEEGTFVPNFTGVGGGEASYSSREGSYTKVGRLVVANVRIDLSSRNTLSGAVQINNLPFTVANLMTGTSVQANGSVGYFAGLSSAASTLVTFPVANQINAQFHFVSGTSSTAMSSLTTTDITDSFNFRATVTYFTT